MCTTLDIYVYMTTLWRICQYFPVFWLSVYLIKVIPEMCPVHYIRYLRCDVSVSIFQSLDYQCTRLRLFQKCVLCTTLDIYVYMTTLWRICQYFPVFWLSTYLIKVILEMCHVHYIRYLRLYDYVVTYLSVFSSLLIISVPDKGYSRHVSCALH